MCEGVCSGVWKCEPRCAGSWFEGFSFRTTVSSQSSCWAVRCSARQVLIATVSISNADVEKGVSARLMECLLISFLGDALQHLTMQGSAVTMQML